MPITLTKYPCFNSQTNLFNQKKKTKDKILPKTLTKNIFGLVGIQPYSYINFGIKSSSPSPISDVNWAS